MVAIVIPLHTITAPARRAPHIYIAPARSLHAMPSSYGVRGARQATIEVVYWDARRCNNIAPTCRACVRYVRMYVYVPLRVLAGADRARVCVCRVVPCLHPVGSAPRVCSC